MDASQFIEPEGELYASMFPDIGDLEAQVAEWLGVAQEKDEVVALETQADRDAAVLAWTYHRAYRHVWLRLASQPQNASLAGQGSVQYGSDQRATFGALSERYLRQYEGVLADAAEGEVSELRSTSTKTKVIW